MRDEQFFFFYGVILSSITGYEVLENHAGPGSVEEEEKIKGKLNFFFLNPIDKYLATRRLPWKLCLQILKVLIVTVQLWIFAGKQIFVLWVPSLKLANVSGPNLIVQTLVDGKLHLLKRKIRSKSFHPIFLFIFK